MSNDRSDCRRKTVDFGTSDAVAVGRAVGYDSAAVGVASVEVCSYQIEASGFGFLVPVGFASDW